jgi:hypothetical protein
MPRQGSPKDADREKFGVSPRCIEIRIASKTASTATWL